MADDSTFAPRELGDGDPGSTEVEAMLRELASDDLELEDPPFDVWAGIAAELADEPITVTDATQADAGTPTPEVVVPFRRRHIWALPALAAAAIVLVMVGAVAIVGSGSDPTTVATAELEFDPAAFDPAGQDAAATAVLLDDDGDEVLEIDDESLPFESEANASLELWMIRVDDGEIVDMVSLGDIEPDGARDYAVPPGYDPAVYSVVDISIEPHDGDPTHSGRSILRGVLGTV